MDFIKAIEIANNIYWVGEYLKNDSFQCHPYFIKNGNESILIDPGSILEFNTVVNKVNQVSNLKNVKYIILHHQDPDLCASVPMLKELIARPDLQIITHSRIKELIKHFCLDIKYYEVDKNNFELLTSTGLELNFLTTPYCHSPGAIVTYEAKTKTLFSSDLFGGITESWNFFADKDYFNEIKSFHESYMPSKDILNFSLSKIEKLDLELIAPQHGSIIKKEFIYDLINKMKKLNCGLYIDKKYNNELIEIKEKENFLNTVIESNNNAIISINKNIVIQIYNKSAQTMFGYTKEEMIGKDALNKIIPANLRKAHRLAVINFIKTKKSIGIIDKYHNISAIRKNGEEFPIRIGFGVTIIENDIVIVANIVDISLQKMQDEKLSQQHEALLYQSTHDALTGLPNRLLFFERFEQTIKKAKKAKILLAILFLDFDHFKEINDSLGHAIGDLLLIEISKKLLNLSLIENNCVSHLGGDSFSIIVEATNNINKITDTANSILSLFQQVIYVQEHEFYITCSIGISVYPKDADTAQTLLRNADSAMYKAKEKGRNNYHFYTADMTERAHQRISIESHLRKALKNQ
ncbi:MAG: diguanylate cyclase [Desulfuromusa sp.]|nr:diguanylate cyclase [Desulfuromusa sp.]